MDQDAERNAPVGEMDEYMDRENETVRDMNGETEGGKRKCVSVTEWPRLGEMETDRGAGMRCDECVWAGRDGLVCLLLPVRGSVLNCRGQIRAWQ